MTDRNRLLYPVYLKDDEVSQLLHLADEFGMIPTIAEKIKATDAWQKRQILERKEKPNGSAGEA